MVFCYIEIEVILSKTPSYIFARDFGLNDRVDLEIYRISKYNYILRTVYYLCSAFSEMHYLNRRLPGLLPYFPTWKMLEIYCGRFEGFPAIFAALKRYLLNVKIRCVYC